MGQEEKIREAQEVLNQAITSLNLTINCTVTAYKHENYAVRVFTKENRLIMPVQIAEEWIKESDPGKNLIHDSLRTLLRNLENYS